MGNSRSIETSESLEFSHATVGRESESRQSKTRSPGSHWELRPDSLHGVIGWNGSLSLRRFPHCATGRGHHNSAYIPPQPWGRLLAGFTTRRVGIQRSRVLLRPLLVTLVMTPWLPEGRSTGKVRSSRAFFSFDDGFDICIRPLSERASLARSCFVRSTELCDRSSRINGTGGSPV